MSPSANPLDQFLQTSVPLHVAMDGQMRFFHSSTKILLPGSFNPIHAGHWRLAETAASILRHPVDFELSVANVDKPDLAIEEIRRRLDQFEGQAAVWLTRAAKFVQKAERFPGAVFVVGADTALRIVSPRYYVDEQDMYNALEKMRTLGSRFLVACRIDARGQCLKKGDLSIPADFVEMFDEIPAERFRFDITSTELRLPPLVTGTPGERGRG